MDELVQRRASADHSTYLGKGKVEELRLMVERHEADLVIFDNDLSPAQTRNLEKAVGAKVLDRTELILDILLQNSNSRRSCGAGGTINLSKFIFDTFLRSSFFQKSTGNRRKSLILTSKSTEN